MLMVFTTSCKKCKLSDGENSTGLIVEDVIIYPKSGYLTENVGPTMHITSTHVYADQFEISFDGGATRGPINYGQYSILGYGMSIPCETSINRDVTYNSTLDVYTYTLTGETCSGCNTNRTIENYVLVPTIPSGAAIIFDDQIVHK